MIVTIDEGVVHMMSAAYRLGALDAGAEPAKEFLVRCKAIIEADTHAEATAVINQERCDRAAVRRDTQADYERAVGILVTHGKASTSYLQRTMAISYNSAADLMVRAESEGIVSKPNHVGKRDVLARIVGAEA